ncbi:FHF complex subunit HOOK interacting protein 1B-like isoform X6 [Penaeus chinensis]|uniref:FHF complex subunit HOOK interacting protein 1B-like isoform X6 n=1 Tax=Penaeus chinensis TaxID=139456 RepID=UPI001FB6967E|nr:FHF complex subunit HOOK interacting protein 1B-like isoform X6 [Penaeus chinensis]
MENDDNECGMTSWLRGSPLRTSLGRRRAPSPLHDVDPAAAFHSFIKHWQQTCEIFARTQLRGQACVDDVTAVINHLAQMVTLLLVDLRQIMAHNTRTQNAENPPHTPIFDHFLGEEILDKVLTWSLNTGEFVNPLKLEQLKVHEQLLSHSRQEILVYKPIIRPLLRLLAACGGCVPVEVEKRLVVLLNQLCVSLMHNHQLLDFFFQFSNDQGPTKFMIFSLLLPFVHREGGIGQQARDALLLCMALSASHTSVGQYIAQHSNFCPVLAAGLSGLYSTLPRTLTIESDGWHRLSPEDISDISQLQLFLNSLEFCNAVVQVAHPLVREQLVEFLYQGFLVPVLGPALHQSVVGEVVAATAYVELCLRTVTEPELRRVFLAFLLTSPKNPALEPPIITILISRLHSPNTQLCLVTLSLFWTLVELNCEDLMIALVFQYLTPCTHVMLSQRSRLTQPPHPGAHASHRLLQLMPAVCQVETQPKKPESGDSSQTPQTSLSPQPSPTTLTVPQHHRSLSNTSSCSSESDSVFEQQTPYSDYLQDARSRIEAGTIACGCWVWRYDGLSPTPTQAMEMLDVARANPPVLYSKPRAHSDPVPVHSSDLPQAEAKVRSVSLPSAMGSREKGDSNETRPVVNGICDNHNNDARGAHHAAAAARGVERAAGVGGEEENLDSLGESSGYESFNIRASRDSSPAHSSHGSPRNRVVHHESPSLEEASSQGSPGDRGPRERKGSVLSSEEDQEFMDTLQRSSTPTEMTGLEETLCEIEQAFTAFKIFDVSSSTSYNKVFRLEMTSDEADWDNQPWQSHESSPPEAMEKVSLTEPSQSRPTIGPFLEALMLRIDQMLTSSIHVNLLVTTVVSRLAAYPTPLLASLLLDSSIVFQPSVRSLVQVLSGLKQKIDAALLPEEASLLVEARTWFITRLIIPRFNPSRPRTPSTASSPDTSLIRGEGKRRSLSQTMNALFRRNTPEQQPSIKESPLEILDDRSGCRYVKRASVSTVDSSTSTGTAGQKRHAARCAVLVRDWLLELSALAQEHTVAVPSIEFRFPSS